MSWQRWFPGRDPDRVGLAEVWHRAAANALEQEGVQVGWLPSVGAVNLPDGKRVTGFAQRAHRRIYSPPPDSLANVVVLLHEIGHIVTDFGRNELESEARASSWAWSYWREHELPDAELARFALARMLEGTIRRQLTAGTVTADDAVAVIPSELGDLIRMDQLAALEAV